MSVWNVFKDRIAFMGTAFLVESECKGTANFLTTKLFREKILKKNYTFYLIY